MPRNRAKFSTIGLPLLLLGCVGLPTAGPLSSEVIEQAGSSPAGLSYVVVPVTEPVSRALASRTSASFREALGNIPAPTQTIGIGDILTISIWEAGSGGLFSTAVQPGQFAQASRGAAIANLVVAADGMITIPYVGRVAVAQLEPAQVEREIVAQLVGKTADPQVLVSVTRNLSSSVTVSGEVANGARVPLSVKGDRVLDVIAATGGVRIPVSDALIQLTRGDRTIGVPYVALLEDPSENIFLHGDDILTVVRDPETFTAFGALAANAQIPFQTRLITLEEAIAKVGGLNDARADPAGVFVFRYESPDIFRTIAPAQVSLGESPVPVVYHLDFHSAESYFLARQFIVRDKDMIYVANARMTEVQKFLTAIGSALAPAATGIGVGASVSAATR